MEPGMMLEKPTSEQKEGWKKYSEYTCKVDAKDGDKAKEMMLLSFARPHMRAFYCCFWGFFNAGFLWFAIAPLLPEIKTSLGLTKEDVWTSSIACVAGTLLMRLTLGPLCDSLGPRFLFALVLSGAAIPTACTGLVNTATGLAVLRFFIGFAGGVIVLCQGWMNAMFTEETIGTATSLITGWGNLASGLTQLWVGSLLFPFFKFVFNGDVNAAWRTVSIVPAAGTAFTLLGFYSSEDTPKGTFHELKKNGVVVGSSASSSLRDGAHNRNTWLLFLQNACATGVELTLNNALALYFQDEFGQATESAAALASIMGWMAVGCAVGGYLSDKANSRRGLHLGGSIAVLALLAIFVHAAEGTTYSLVPFVAPQSTGSVSGIVSAGGNIGAIVFGLFFRQLDYGLAFSLVGICVLASSLLTVLINIDTSKKLVDSEGSAGQMMDASGFTEDGSSLNLNNKTDEDANYASALGGIIESGLKYDSDHEGDEISV